MAEIITKDKRVYLHIDGFLYLRHYKGKNGVVYWRCRKYPECKVRVTTTSQGNNINVKNTPDEDAHTNHAPNREEVAALKIISSIKRKATEQPEAPPAQLLRTAYQDIPAGILTELPDRLNVRKIIQRQRLRDLPAAPRSIEELEEIPDQYRITKKGERFLAYDSFSDTSYNLSCGRILVFATRENLRQLMLSRFWFVDGTFRTAPNIFFQLFTISGSTTQIVNGQEQTIALPFVFSLLQGKMVIAYTKVFNVVQQITQQKGLRVALPEYVLSDFELAIINAAKSFVGERVRGCFFHLRQNIWKHIQTNGVQTAYNDENDRSIKEAAQMMCSCICAYG